METGIIRNKIENGIEIVGVMVMKDGKAWGVNYSDGQCTSYGWIDPILADIQDPRFCTRPTDVTYVNSPYIDELRTAKCVMVKKTIIVETEQSEQLHENVADLEYNQTLESSEVAMGKYTKHLWKTVKDKMKEIENAYQHGREDAIKELKPTTTNIND